jgi:hypothetical protein
MTAPRACWDVATCKPLGPRSGALKKCVKQIAHDLNAASFANLSPQRSR